MSSSSSASDQDRSACCTRQRPSRSSTFWRCDGVDVVAGGLLFEVVDSQRHDREPVDRAAGRFGVERRAGLRHDAARGERFEQRFVDPFDPVVALLVVAVDRALDRGDALVADVGAAGDVFFVPEQVVELMLLADDGEEAVVGIVDAAVVPAADGVAVQLGDLLDQLLGGGQRMR